MGIPFDELQKGADAINRERFTLGGYDGSTGGAFSKPERPDAALIELRKFAVERAIELADCTWTAASTVRAAEAIERYLLDPPNPA